IATRVGGVPEVVIEGETGILVPPEPGTDVAAGLARAIARAVAEPIPRDAFAAGRARTLARFEPRALAARVAGVYGELLAAGATVDVGRIHRAVGAVGLVGHREARLVDEPKARRPGSRRELPVLPAEKISLRQQADAFEHSTADQHQCARDERAVEPPFVLA